MKNREDQGAYAPFSSAEICSQYREFEQLMLHQQQAQPLSQRRGSGLIFTGKVVVTPFLMASSLVVPSVIIKNVQTGNLGWRMGGVSMGTLAISARRLFPTTLVKQGRKSGSAHTEGETTYTPALFAVSIEAGMSGLDGYGIKASQLVKVGMQDQLPLPPKTLAKALPWYFNTMKAFTPYMVPTTLAMSGTNVVMLMMGLPKIKHAVQESFPSEATGAIVGTITGAALVNIVITPLSTLQARYIAAAEMQVAKDGKVTVLPKTHLLKLGQEAFSSNAALRSLYRSYPIATLMTCIAYGVIQGVNKVAKHLDSEEPSKMSVADKGIFASKASSASNQKAHPKSLAK